MTTLGNDKLWFKAFTPRRALKSVGEGLNGGLPGGVKRKRVSEDVCDVIEDVEMIDIITRRLQKIERVTVIGCVLRGEASQLKRGFDMCAEGDQAL